jgi:hypothetical protein
MLHLMWRSYQWNGTARQHRSSAIHSFPDLHHKIDQVQVVSKPVLTDKREGPLRYVRKFLVFWRLVNVGQVCKLLVDPVTGHCRRK